MKPKPKRLLTVTVAFLVTGTCAGLLDPVAQAGRTREGSAASASSRTAPVNVARLASATQASKKPPRYTVTDLGTLGGTLSLAMGINDKGWVDGFSNLAGDVAQHAFLWRRGVMTDLGTPGGPNSGVGFWGQAPNERGSVAGAGETSTVDPLNEAFCNGFNSYFNAPATQYECRPFVWQAGAITPLPTFGGNNGVANQINDRGQVAGAAETPSPDPTCTTPRLTLLPALWENGAIHQLPTLPGDPDGVVNAINDHGQAVGVSVGSCSGSPAHAALWARGAVTGLGSLGGTAFDEANGINNHGDAVGFSSLPGDTYFHAFSWTRRSGMQDLGVLPGDANSIAIRINSKGLVVGLSCDVSGNCRAVLWEAGAMTDLNTLTPSSSLLFLIAAFGINSRGQIVGLAATPNGQLHAYLATPESSQPDEEPLDGARQTAAGRHAHAAARNSARSALDPQLRLGRLLTARPLP